jgi:hypothetical protein
MDKNVKKGLEQTRISGRVQMLKHRCNRLCR